MRRLTTYLAVAVTALCGVVAGYGKDGYRSMVLECSVPPGQELRIDLDSEVSISYSYGLMIISGRRLYVQVPLDNVLRWTFSKTGGEVTDGIADAVGADVQIGPCQAVISGVDYGTPIELYDMSGTLRLQATAVGAEAVVPFDNLATGVYILRVGNNTYKVGVR